MKISGKKGFYRLKNLDRTRIEDDKEVIVKGTWTRIYGKVASEADEVYVPVVEGDKELTMLKLKNLTLVAAIGQRIKELREEKGWTQLGLASRLRIVRSRLADIERGHEKPSNAMFFALSDLFRVPVIEIYADIDIVSEERFFDKKKGNF